MRDPEHKPKHLRGRPMDTRNGSTTEHFSLQVRCYKARWAKRGFSNYPGMEGDMANIGIVTRGRNSG